MYLSAKAEGCTGRVHSHVSAADDCHLVALRDRGIVIFIKGLHQVISGQILVGGEYAAGCLARIPMNFGSPAPEPMNTASKPSPHQLVDGDGLSYDHVGLNLHAQRFHILHLGKHGRRPWEDGTPECRIPARRLPCAEPRRWSRHSPASPDRRHRSGLRGRNR